MNHQFDELTKNLARPIPRRAALKQVGASLAVAALATFGMANQANAWFIIRAKKPCQSDADCPKGKVCVTDSSGRGACLRLP